MSNKASKNPSCLAHCFSSSTGGAAFSFTLPQCARLLCSLARLQASGVSKSETQRHNVLDLCVPVSLSPARPTFFPLEKSLLPPIVFSWAHDPIQI